MSDGWAEPDAESGWAEPDAKTWSSYIPAAVSDIPAEIKKSAAENWDAIKSGFSPSGKGQQGALAGTLATGSAIAAVPGLLASPITGAARSLLGHPLAQAEHAAGTLINPSVAAKDNPQEMYETAKGNVDTAMTGLAPSRGGLAALRGPVTVPPPPTGPLGVTLSEGQETGKLPLIQKEWAAERGQLGNRAQGIAKQFFDQQRDQAATAKENVGKSLDAFGQQVVESPQEAGQLVSDSLRKTAQDQKASVKRAYDIANEMPGEIHAGAFEGIGQKIKGDLTLGDNPVIIDDKTTPFASQAIQDIDKTISRLRIQNRADPFGQPNPENITGISLKGVDQARRRLSTFRTDAWRSGNAADGRAASAIVDSFDSTIDNAINNGLFSGDPRAVSAWNAARAAHADYAGTFTAGKNNPVGRVVEKIIGKGKNEPAIGNDVADFMYGAPGTNPNSLNVGVVKRIKGILGEDSPEWSAAKQGLYSRLVEPPEGMTEWGPGKVAQRITKFMNGDGAEMSRVIFTDADRQMLRNYVRLQRTLEIPKGGANYSESSTHLAPMLRKINAGIAAVVGGIIGHAIAPGAYGVGEGIGAMIAGKGTGMISDIRSARQIARQMPLIEQSTRQYQRAVAAANKANAPQTAKTAAIAYSNLARSLEPLGIRLESLLSGQGTVPASADQQQNP